MVSAANPRYFTVASGAAAGKAVYLTGSHIWNDLRDGLGPGGSCAGQPESNDYQAYLAFLSGCSRDGGFTAPFAPPRPAVLHLRRAGR